MPPEIRPTDRESVNALIRGLKVIEAFDTGHPEMTLSEIARRTELTPATARRCLRTLAALGYVREIDRRFLLMPRILGLGSSYLRSMHVEDALMPEIRRVVEQFGDATSVGVLAGGDVLYIAHLSEQRSLRPSAGVGISYPAFATSLGRVLLSHRAEAEIVRILRARPLPALTDQTTTDPRRLMEIIMQARQRGYATATDQLAYGVTSIAVPIVDPSGNAVAALNSSGYSGRVSEAELVHQRLAELQVSAARISRTLLRYPALLRSLAIEVEDAAPDGTGMPAPVGHGIANRRSRIRSAS